MKQYNTYKPSGIEWLGDIPEHWEVKRVKDFGEYQSGYFIDANEFDNDNDYPVFGGNGLRGYACKFNHNGEYILIGRQGALCGNVNFASGKFWATEHAVVVYSKKGIHKRWYAYLLEIMNLNQYAISAAQPGLSVEKIRRLMLPYISFTEQTAIANYLDTKTAAIDRKIELLTTKANKYKALRRSLINETVCRGLNPNAPLKDSDIEWIGKIPEHWEVKRVKDNLDLLTGNSISDKTDFEDSNNSIPYVATKDIEINSCNIDYENGIYIPRKELKKFKTINPNSILLCIEGGSAGKKIAFNTRRICFVNKLCSFSSKGNAVDIKYNFYQMQSAPWLFQFNQVMNGLIGGVSVSLLKTFRLITPPKNEQVEIANYLNEKTTQIDTILTNISEQITKFTQLRKTLINDVVTGKIKVTEE